MLFKYGEREIKIETKELDIQEYSLFKALLHCSLTVFSHHLSNHLLTALGVNGVFLSQYAPD